MTNALIIIFVTILFIVCGYLLGYILWGIFGDDKTNEQKENKHTERVEKKIRNVIVANFLTNAARQ